ncbi:hypothetical protein FSARC_13739 [Fusarium sarcochroum]|uniref:Reticulocyte-binding protein 2 like protein a n=1 Tax=Fusarium sarcochroum TaxID=1208366 RepID=A0A8H4SZ67_9HYPO|nr:hypothetical protein FSARC_13739 [Fusarium sarcochroum]
MSGPPPPPPPHGGVPKGNGLPPGKYDIFVIPEHSSGGGFLYLPSMQPNVNSFAAGFASALILVVLGQTLAPAFRTWWEGFHGLGNMAIAMLIVGVGFGAWSLGRFQTGSGPGSSGPGNSGRDNPGGWNSGFRSANAGSPPPPPPHSTPPPPPHGDAPPRPPPHDGPKTSWQGSPQSDPPPRPPPPRPEPQPEPQQAPRSEPEPPPRPPPQARPPPPQTPPETPPKPKPRAPSPPPKPRDETPTPKPKPKPEPESSPAPKADKAARAAKAEAARQKGSWEKAREEMRKKEEERKVKEAEQKRREEAARRLAELRAKDAKERQEREKERERKEQEAREKRERLEAEQRAKDLAIKLEHERKERERLEKEAKEIRERLENEAKEAREREAQRQKEARELEEKKKREAEERDARRKKFAAEREALRKREAEEAKRREEEKKQKDLEKQQELEKQREKEKAEREKAEKEKAAKEAEAAAAATASRQASSYAYSGGGEKISMWPNGRPSTSARSTTSSTPKPAPSAASSHPKPPPSAASSHRKPTPSAAKSNVSGVSTENSYRPYDKPRQPRHKDSLSSIGSESSWAASQTTGRTSPPPSARGGPYSTKDPDKIVISGVYLFMNQFSKTPASQLISGVGTVTDGLILRITTEGLFIDDDVRCVPQREWDVKAWTLKQVEVWCPPHCLNSPSVSTPAPGTKPNPLLYQMASSRARDRGATKPLVGDEADVYLTEMLRACKTCCRLGLCDRTFRDTNIASSTGQTGEWKSKGLHLLRASVRDQEGKRYLFVIDESESWKVSVGLQRLRRGTQVRSLAVSGMAASDARGTLEMLGWAS